MLNPDEEEAQRLKDEEQDRIRREKSNRALLFVLSILAVVFMIGMIGFRYIVKLDWIDCFLNTAFYTAGIGPIATMHTPGQKMFAAAYAMLSGLIFITMASFILTHILVLMYPDLAD